MTAIPVDRHERLIEDALVLLPKRCKYHGDDFEVDRFGRTLPCCDSGELAFRRALAMSALFDMNAARRSGTR